MSHSRALNLSAPRVLFGRVLSIAATLALGAGLVASCSGGGGTSTDSTTSTGSGGGSGSGGKGGGGGGVSIPCATDCSTTAATPVCDTSTGQCVQCLPGDSTCGEGQYCATSKTCKPGCSDDKACAAPLVCNPTTHTCSGCAKDSQCDQGKVCGPAGECIQGCSPTQPCPAGSECCNSGCSETKTDPANCGGCDKPCAMLPNAESSCTDGVCGLAMCAAGFADCNHDAADGCELDTTANGPCACTPGDTMACYTGPAGTQGVGTCAPGTATCDPSGASWGPCIGEKTPGFEICADGLDNDCDGTVDNTPDQDGDGWTTCQGDCCDSPSGCGSPNLVNPGAFEVAGNMVDDDCDGMVDNVLPICDTALVSNSGIATDYAKAIDLCATTLENPPTPQQKTWGVISAGFYKADGSGTPSANAKSIRKGFGSGVVPLHGSSIAVLSTGVAAAQTAPNNTNPNWVAPEQGASSGLTSGVPADWLAANGNKFPNAPGCPAPNGGNVANDPVMLKIRVRVPTNANSFSVSTFFYSAEFPEWVCSPYNDFFLTLLDSSFVPAAGQVANPKDKNLAFYDPPPAGGAVYPVGVNLAFGNTGLFSQCLNGPTGCASGSVAGSISTCAGTAQIAGTGFDAVAAMGCGSSNRVGGGTGWLTTGGNVKPGETIELRFVTWDTGDTLYDSTVLLDNFTWSVSAATPGTHQ
jgi:Putative metal-binding motif